MTTKHPYGPRPSAGGRIFPSFASPFAIRPAAAAFLAALLLFATPSHAQSFEVQQLLLDIQKLAGMKNTLDDLYKSYEILDQGYAKIRDIAQGNFNLHKAFLDGLLLVSPFIRSEQKVAMILESQASLVASSAKTWDRIRYDGRFTPQELTWFGSVLQSLSRESLLNLDNLLKILTDGAFRMSDDERLHAIDRIGEDTRDQSAFLHAFTNSATLLAAQRTGELNDNATLRQLYRSPP